MSGELRTARCCRTDDLAKNYAFELLEAIIERLDRLITLADTSRPDRSGAEAQSTGNRCFRDIPPARCRVQDRPGGDICPWTTERECCWYVDCMTVPKYRDALTKREAAKEPAPGGGEEKS